MGRRVRRKGAIHIGQLQTFIKISYPCSHLQRVGGVLIFVRVTQASHAWWMSYLSICPKSWWQRQTRCQSVNMETNFECLSKISRSEKQWGCSFSSVFQGKTYDAQRSSITECCMLTVSISNLNKSWLDHIARSNIKSRNVSRRYVQAIQWHIITTLQLKKMGGLLLWAPGRFLQYSPNHSLSSDTANFPLGYALRRWHMQTSFPPRHITAELSRAGTFHPTILNILLGHTQITSTKSWICLTPPHLYFTQPDSTFHRQQ